MKTGTKTMKSQTMKSQRRTQKAAWTLGMIAVLISVAMSLTACGSNGNNGGGAIAPIGPTPIGPSQVCQPNQIYTTTHGCLYQQSCQNGFGWVPGEGRCVPGTIVNSPSGTGFFTSLTITDPGTFALLLQRFGKCDPYVIGINLGSSSCDNYTKAGYLVMQFPGGLTNGALPAQSSLTIGAGSRSPNEYNSNWITGGLVHLLPYITTNSLTNNSAGFTGIPASGGAPGGFRFVVNSGLPGSAYQMDVDLLYNGSVFARGRLTRY